MRPTFSTRSEHDERIEASGHRQPGPPDDHGRNGRGRNEEHYEGRVCKNGDQEGGYGKVARPFEADSEGARCLLGTLRHLEGGVRHRGAPGLVTAWGGPLLQPGLQWLLRRCPLLSRRGGVRGRG